MSESQANVTGCQWWKDLGPTNQARFAKAQARIWKRVEAKAKQQEAKPRRAVCLV